MKVKRKNEGCENREEGGKRGGRMKEKRKKENEGRKEVKM